MGRERSGLELILPIREPDVVFRRHLESEAFMWSQSHEVFISYIGRAKFFPLYICLHCNIVF